MVLNKETKLAANKPSPFAGIEAVKVGQKRLYLSEVAGTHVLSVQRIVCDQNQTGIFFLAADFKVEETSSTVAKPGEILSFYVDTSKFAGALFLKESKRLAAAVLGAEIDLIDETDLLGIVSEKQPCTGQKIKAVVSPKLDKKTGVQAVTKTGIGINRVDFFPSAKA